MCPLRTKFSQEENYYNLDNMLLLSCTPLQNLFRTHWLKQTGEDWINSEENGVMLFELCVSRICRQKKKMMKIVKKGFLEEWEISILSLLLPAFGDTTTDEKDAENKSIKTLKEIRDFVKHLVPKKLNCAEYKSRMDTIRHSLETLHVESKAINQMMEQAVVKSEDNAKKKVEKLYKNAEDYIKKGDIEGTEMCLTESVNMPSLPTNDLAEAYEKRAEFYIQNCKVKLDQAFRDASEALQLNGSSWKAYYLIAQINRHRHKFKEAIENLERGLSLYPVHEAIWQELDECRVMDLERDCVDFLQQQYLPGNLGECVKLFEDGTGLQISESEYLFLNESRTAEQFSKGYTHVFKGRQYQNGLGVQKNLVKACEHYNKAAKLKNPDGIYYLAICTNRGQGVKQNVVESLKLYQQAAKMSADTVGEFTGRGKSLGVTFSQHSVGLAYEFGYVVPQDYKEAARWYKKSAENGAAQACNDLGHFYMEGLGVPKNRKLGEFYLKESITLDVAGGVEELINYYIAELEPERAESAFKIAQEMNCPVLPNITDEKLTKELPRLRLIRKKHEAAVIEFEASNRIEKRGFTFRERLIRMNPNNPFFRHIEKPILGDEDVFFSNFFNSQQNMVWSAKKTETVLNVLKLLANCEKISKLLQPTEPFYLEEDAEQIMQLVYSSITIPFDQLLLPGEDELKLKHATQQLFKTRSSSIGHDDERLRLIYAAYNLKMVTKTTNDLFGEILLREGHRRYPQNYYYHYYLSKICNDKSLFDDALKFANEGLLNAPLDVNLLYEKAVCLKNVKSDETVEAFRKFLDLAPRDHPCFPEAHFAISESYIKRKMIYLFRDSKIEVNEHIEGLIDKHYELGVLAAKERHSFFKMTEHNSRILAEQYIFNQRREHQCQPGWFEVLGVLERKPYLISPTRKALVLEQRNDLLPENERTTKVYLQITTIPPNLKQAPPKRFSALKPINIYEINPTAMDKIYQDRIIDLTIIEEPAFFRASIHLKAEDENGDVIRLYIYNVEQNEKAEAKYGFGCKIAVMNPYMCRDRERLSSRNHGIRVDDPRCIIHLGKIENMCRFCGEADATFNCPECSVTKYCSDECQKLDLDEFKHGSICKYLRM